MPKRHAIEHVDKFLYAMINYLKHFRKFYHSMYLRDLQILLFIHRDNEEHQVTVSQLANHLRVTPAAASQLISNYEKKNWVNRIHSKKDRRTVYVRVSDQVLDMMHADIKFINKQLSVQLDKYTDEELIGFAKVLNIISTNLEHDAVFFHRPETEE